MDFRQYFFNCKNILRGFKNFNEQLFTGQLLCVPLSDVVKKSPEKHSGRIVAYNTWPFVNILCPYNVLNTGIDLALSVENEKKSRLLKETGCNEKFKPSCYDYLF